MSDELNNIKGENKTCELMNWSLIILDDGIKNTFKVTIPAARSYGEIATEKETTSLLEHTGQNLLFKLPAARQFKELSFYKPIRI